MLVVSSYCHCQYCRSAKRTSDTGGKDLPTVLSLHQSGGPDTILPLVEYSVGCGEGVTGGGGAEWAQEGGSEAVASPPHPIRHVGLHGPTQSFSSLRWQNSWFRTEEAHCQASTLAWRNRANVSLPKKPPTAAMVPIGCSTSHFWYHCSYGRWAV